MSAIHNLKLMIRSDVLKRDKNTIPRRVWIQPQLSLYQANGNTHSHKSSIHELLWEIDDFCSQVFAAILPQGIVCAARIVTSIQVVMEKEMNSFDVGHLKTIDRLAMVLLGSEQFSNSVDGQEASQPIPLIVMSHEETHIAVTAFVSRPA